MSCFFFSSRRRHTRCSRDWSSDVCSSDLGGMQIALVVAANQFAVLGKGHITFLDAGAHARARFMAFLGVLRELQSAAAPVTDRKGRLAERALAALLQPALERAGAHLVDQIKGTRPDLDTAVFVRIALVSVVVGVGKYG